MSPLLLAHVVPGFGNLGVSVWFVVYGVVAAFVLVTLGLRAQWVTSRFGPADRDERLDGPWPATLAGRVAVVAGALFGTIVFGVVLAAAWSGDAAVGSNIAPLAVFVAFWIGLQWVSAFLGDVWSLVNPFLVVGMIRDVQASRRGGPATGPDQVDVESGPEAPWWVPALVLASFLWLWLADGTGTHPRSIAVWLTLDAVLMIGGAALGGRRWLATADPFTVVFGALGDLAPLGRNGSGKWRFRAPFVHIGRRRGDRRLAAVLTVYAGGLLFDWIGTTTWWTKAFGSQSNLNGTLVNTGGLLWLILVAGLVWWLVVAIAGWREGAHDRALVTERAVGLAPALVPALAGLSLAHYLSLLLIQIQNVAILASDPFGRGWNLFGTIDWSLNLQPVRPAVAGCIELALIVAGTLATLVLVHDRAIDTLGARTARRLQVPLAVFVAVLAVGGLRIVLTA